MATIAVSGQWTRLRTLGRGASGAVVTLASDAASGQLFAVKSAPSSSSSEYAAPLAREHAILSALSSPDVVRCVGGGHDHRDGSYHLFLEFAPGGSLADEVDRNGGRLEERAIRAYAADVLRGLAYIHSNSIVHGDVKSRNIVIGADGRAKLADFGCARTQLDSARPIGGTPAFMAPEVARGEEQGPAADVWALGCTVVEMATGRAPWWTDDTGNVLAALHRIGYTDAVPEVPAWLSPDAKGFLTACFARDARDRCTAAELLEHPFLALRDAGEAKVAVSWVSPKSTLDAAFWESETEDEDEDENAAERIKSLSCSVEDLPEDWDSDQGCWMDVLGGQCDDVCDSLAATKVPADVASSAPSKVSGSAAVPAEDIAVVVVVGSLSTSDDEQLDAEEEEDGNFGGDILAADPSIDRQSKVDIDRESKVSIDPRNYNVCSSSERDVVSFETVLQCKHGIDAIETFHFPQKILSRVLMTFSLPFILCSGPVLISASLVLTEFFCS